MADFCLVTQTDSGAVETHPLVPPGPVSIGRLPSSGIVVGNEKVSRSHARLEWMPDRERWRVVDAGSQHGTHVNGRRLGKDQWAVLDPGTEVSFGPVHFELVAGAAGPGATVMGGDSSDGPERIEWLKPGRSEDLSHQHLSRLLDLSAGFQTAADESTARTMLVEGVADATTFANVAFVVRHSGEDRIEVSDHVGEAFDRQGRPRMSRSVLRKAREDMVLVTDRSEVGDVRMAASLERASVSQAFCIPVGKRAEFGFLYADSGSAQVERARLEEAAKVSHALVRMAADRIRQFRDATEMDALWRATLQMVVHMVEQKDPCTRGHSERVAQLARLLARTLGLDESTCTLVYQCGRVHDIGKVGIADDLLTYPGRLDEAQFAEMRKHPEKGVMILSPHPHMQSVIPGVLEHHEKWDGTGYPRRLAGETISMVGRLIAVADVFDALTCERPYRPAMSIEKARSIIEEGSGSHFDPAIAKVFLGIPLEVLRRHTEAGGSVTR